MKNSFLQFGIEQKNFYEENNTLKIRGMASTKFIDRHNDIIEPMAFAKSIGLFMSNPVMLLQHNMDKPIGKFTNLKMTDDGLEVEGEVLHNEDGVIDKIKSGVLQAFSVGFIPKKYEVKDEKGNLLATEEGIGKNVGFEQLFNRKNTKTITELELVEISVVSIPSNARSLFGITESAKKFFENISENWKEEMKSIETETETETETDTNIPPSGDELVDTDNVANEIISEIPETTETDEKNSEASEISSEVETKNAENISENIYNSEIYKKLFTEKTEITEIAKNLVFELEKVQAENEELKNILKNTPVRKGMVNIGGQIQPKQKSFIEKLIDEAENYNF